MIGMTMLGYIAADDTTTHQLLVEQQLAFAQPLSPDPHHTHLWESVCRMELCVLVRVPLG